VRSNSQSASPKRVLLQIGLVTLAAIATGACGVNTAADVRGIANDNSAQNVALLFGASNDLPGIDVDLDIMTKLLQDREAGHKFQVVSELEATPAEILAITGEHAPKVGENGTLFWYFSGHGGWGSLVADGNQLIRFSAVAKAIKDSRQKPLKRLVVVIDTCNNGNLTQTIPRDNLSLASSANSSEEMAAEMADAVVAAFGGNPTSKTSTRSDSTSYSGTMAEEILVVTSSTEQQTSQATSRGSVFTLAFRDAFAKHARERSSVNEFLETTRTLTEERGRHTPQVRAVPESLLSAPLIRPIEGGVIPPQPQPDSNAIYVALDSVAGSADSSLARLKVATPVGAARVVICNDAAASCLAAPRADLTLVASGSVGTRPLFVTPADFSPRSGLTFTILVYSVAGQVLASRSLQLVAR